MSSVSIQSNMEAHALASRGVLQWPIWTKEISTFPWTYTETEYCYILEGEVTVTTEDGQTFHLKPKDFVRFGQGLTCTWQIHAPVRKHYMFDDTHAL